MLFTISPKDSTITCKSLIDEQPFTTAESIQQITSINDDDYVASVSINTPLRH